jgi:GTP-binding protein
MADREWFARTRQPVRPREVSSDQSRVFYRSPSHRPAGMVPMRAAAPPVPRFESASFTISVAELEQLKRAPLAMVPEVAFAGRSNAGKSTVINVLTAQRQLAHASKTPGRTQLLNFFQLAEPDPTGRPQVVAYLVDLPGYGFARVNEQTRSRWDELVGGYLAGRRLLAGVVVVMDARRPLATADEHLLAWLAARGDAARLRVHLLLNKADQIGRAERARAQAAAERRAEALPMPVSVQLFSGLKREGIEELRETLAEILGG